MCRWQRSVIHHYLNSATRVIVAVDQPGGNPWINHHLELALSRPRGSSTTVDALQYALLAVGSTHMQFLARGGDVAGVSTSAMAHTLKLLATEAGTPGGACVVSADREGLITRLAALLSAMVSAVSISCLPCPNFAEFVRQHGMARYLKNDPGNIRSKRWHRSRASSSCSFPTPVFSIHSGRTRHPRRIR